MLGHRGCRLGITYPEITEMQARAIFEAAVAVEKQGRKTHAEVMIPLIATVKEMENQAAIVRRRGGRSFPREREEGALPRGTMIELPRAALLAGRDRQGGRVLQLRHQRSHPNHIRILAR